IALRVRRIAEDDGEFGDDSEAPNSGGECDRIFGMEVLVHFFQNPVRARFGTEENHCATCLAYRLPGSIGVAHHDVSAAFAPPPHATSSDALHQFAGVLLAEKEIVVIELDRVHTIVLCQVTKSFLGPGRRLHLLPAAGKGDHSAEVATEGASDAGLV